MAMNMVRCSLGYEHPACEICGATDPAALVSHDLWPFGVESPGRPEMTTCLSCRNKVFARIDTVAKIRLLIGLEQRVSVPAPAGPAIPPGTLGPPRDTTMKSPPRDTAETQVMPVLLD